MNGEVSVADGVAALVAIGTALVAVAKLFIAPLRLMIEENKRASIAGYKKLEERIYERRDDDVKQFETLTDVRVEAAYERGVRDGKEKRNGAT